MESSVEDIAKFVFSTEPKQENTIKLIPDEADLEYIFEMILNLLLEGLYILYGSNFDIQQLNTEIISRLNEYMKSMGFIMEYHTTKGGHCYCDLKKLMDDGKPYVFFIDRHQKRKNEFIERKKLTDYYVNLGNGAQLNFSFCYSALNDNDTRQGHQNRHLNNE